MMTTTSIGGLYAGRLVIGLANGLYMTFSQLYLQVSSFLSCSRDVAYFHRNVLQHGIEVSLLELSRVGLPLVRININERS